MAYMGEEMGQKLSSQTGFDGKKSMVYDVRDARVVHLISTDKNKAISVIPLDSRLRKYPKTS